MDSMKNKQDDEEEKLPHINRAGKQQSYNIDPHNLREFQAIQEMNRDQYFRSESIMNASKNLKMFKITKVNNKKDDSQNSYYNISSEEQKNIIMNYNTSKGRLKSSNLASEGDSNISTKGTTSFI